MAKNRQNKNYTIFLNVHHILQRMCYLKRFEMHSFPPSFKVSQVKNVELEKLLNFFLCVYHILLKLHSLKRPKRLEMYWPLIGMSFRLNMAENSVFCSLNRKVSSYVEISNQLTQLDSWIEMRGLLRSAKCHLNSARQQDLFGMCPQVKLGKKSTNTLEKSTKYIDVCSVYIFNVYILGR